MSKGVCEYCGKSLGNNRKTICGCCIKKIKDIQWFMKQLKPYRVALERRKVRAMFDVNP